MGLQRVGHDLNDSHFHVPYIMVNPNTILWGNYCENHSVVSNSLWPHGPYGLWNFPGQNTGVGNLSLLQGIFPTQGWNPGLPHCRWILYQLSYKGSPRILQWVAYPFFRGSPWPRNWTGVSCITGDSLPIELSGKPLYRWWDWVLESEITCPRLLS